MTNSFCLASDSDHCDRFKLACPTVVLVHCISSQFTVQPMLCVGSIRAKTCIRLKAFFLCRIQWHNGITTVTCILVLVTVHNISTTYFSGSLSTKTSERPKTNSEVPAAFLLFILDQSCKIDWKGPGSIMPKNIYCLWMQPMTAKRVASRR